MRSAIIALGLLFGLSIGSTALLLSGAAHAESGSAQGPTYTENSWGGAG